MSDCVLPLDPETLLITTEEARAAAAPHAELYQNRDPYPYGCLDNFLPPEILEHVIKELEDLPAAEESFDRAQEKLKTSYMPERLPPYTRSLFYALNARPTLKFLETLTGIKGLIPDPYFMGGGIHKVANGGHLDIHADFNHHKVMNLERRLNILIYLNKDWKEEYGGSFEIWAPGMTHKVEGFVPIFNRMCCFNTSSDSWHGNPETVNHPDGQNRMSIALYYYTATWDDSRKAHTTLFKPRPGTADRVDYQVALRSLAYDLMPPLVMRGIKRLKKGAGSSS